MTLSTQNVEALRTFARNQAEQLHAEFAFAADYLRTLSVTQPNGRATVSLHQFARQTQLAERRWERVGGCR